MPKNLSPLQQPLDAIVFDCDATLSTIEGIDELAGQNGVGDQVKALTSEAMERSGLTEKLYSQRLALVRPTEAQITALGTTYLQHVTPDTKAVIQTLRRLNKAVYLISAGVYPAVLSFGVALQIPEKNIFAVKIIFDADGNYQNFDRTSPLVTDHGKRDIVSMLMKQHPRIAHIGDGMNDIATKDLVTRFIGYGGAYYRKKIEDMSDFYVKTSSMTGVLPYILTQEEQTLLHAI